jgi:hypothetical protein
MRRTAYFAAASMLAISTSAFALDDTPDNTRIISDPLYLPMQGQVYGSTAYNWGSASQDVFDATGTHTAFDQITTNTLTQQFWYGLADDVTLRLDWGYDWRSASRHLDPTGGIFRSSSGWTDPDFGITWRAIDQGSSGPFDLDLRAGYSPDAFPAKIATTEDEGTIARGGQAANFGLTLGHETRAFTVAATFDANWLDTSKAINETTGGFTATDSRWNYRLGLASQIRFDPVTSVNLGAGHTFSNAALVFNSDSGLDHFSRGGDFTDLNVALNYHFVPNTLVGSLGYQHNFYDDTHNVFPTAPADDTSIRNKNEDIVGVTMRYVLN